jgi:hypothetical protein
LLISRRLESPGHADVQKLDISAVIGCANPQLASRLQGHNALAGCELLAVGCLDREDRSGGWCLHGLQAVDFL